MPDPTTFDHFTQKSAAALRTRDEAPISRAGWERRRGELLPAIRAALGALPEQPAPLNAKVLGDLKRDGYRVERLIYQTQPDVWVTANAYVPDPLPNGKVPAVLVVHGHWAWARRDPVVQARCVGLAKLGFFVLAVDAFGAGERYTAPAQGTYHGGLYGAGLWPAGLTLLGMQVYENRRAVDYLLTRPEVDGTKLGVTGASGGGNQTMYAGALDERFAAAVPVCSVGSYLAYLKAACCVCEVLPGALRFTEEGDVLGLVAPRALLVLTAAKDAYQFSPAAAEPTVARAQKVFALHGQATKFRHVTFDSGHDYNKPMREAMYGWMARWLKGEGGGDPIPEPSFTPEKPEDLNCFAAGERPKAWLTPPTLAARAARTLAEKARKPTHAEEWEATATFQRAQLKKVLGGLPPIPRLAVQPGQPQRTGDVTATTYTLTPEPELPITAVLKSKGGPAPRQPAAVLLDLDGSASALKHPLADAFIAKGWLVAAPDLRATGAAKPAGDAVRTAVDHNSAEHAVWVGRPLLGQWAFDVLCLLDWLAIQPGLDPRRLSVVGLGPAGVVAVTAGALAETAAAVAAVRVPSSVIPTEGHEARNLRMGLLAPNLLTVGDVPHLAALLAPRRLFIADAYSTAGVRMRDAELREAFAFPLAVYQAVGAAERFAVAADRRPEDVVAAL